MTDHPILFSTPMVRAIIEGRKSQTRRTLKIKGRPGFFDFGPFVTKGYDWHFRRSDHVWEGFRHDDLLRLLPYAIGDRLWVREHWKSGPAYDDLPPRDMSGEEAILYLADGVEQKWGWDHPQVYGRHRQAMHMPRWASRLTLTVTNVRVERLQDISSRDCIKEGCSADQNILDSWRAAYSEKHRRDEYHRAHISPFRTLWDSMNADRGYGWAENPWVCAYSFDAHKGNIDQRTAA